MIMSRECGGVLERKEWLLQANEACGAADCDAAHTVLHTYRDGQGWFRTRSCATAREPAALWRPQKTQDKNDSERLAHTARGEAVNLCGFHVPVAWKEEFVGAVLRALLPVLMAGLYAIKVSHYPAQRRRRQDAWLTFLAAEVPRELLPHAELASVVKYLRENWFESEEWGGSWTRETVMLLPEGERRSVLVYTGNTYERFFRTMVECFLGHVVCRRVLTAVHVFVESVLRDSASSAAAAAAEPSPRPPSLPRVEAARQGLAMVGRVCATNIPDLYIVKPAEVIQVPGSVHPVFLRSLVFC